MGQTVSTSKGITREMLLKGTESNREIIQKLFKRFLDTLTPEEILELSNPAACNKYVFVMANALHRIFSELKIVPTKDRSGVLLFQKADTLTKKDAQDEDFRRNCLEVSYFYIRIFQIFGALALTVVDSPGAGHVVAAYRAQVDAKGQALGTVGARGVVLSGGVRPPMTPYGIGPQRIQQVQQLQGRKNAFSLFYENGYFSQSPDNVAFPFKQYPSTMFFNYKPGQFSQIYYHRASYDIEVDILLKAVGVFQIKNFFIITYDPQGRKKRTPISYIPQAIKIVYKKSEPSTLYNISKNQDVDRSIHDLLDIVYRYTKNTSDSILKQQLQEIIEAGNRNETYITKDIGQPGLPYAPAAPAQAGIRGQPGFIPTRSDVGSLSALQSGYLRDILSGIRGKPVALCVARALQLIDTNVLTGMPKSLQTGICKTSFDSMPGSIPIAGKTLDSYRPLFAADQLFYNKKGFKRDPTTGAIKTDIQVEDVNAHKDFLQQMMTWFGKTGGTVTTESPLSSVGIVNQYCQDSTLIGKSLQITNPDAIRKIVGSVHQLFAYQLAHTKKVMEFLGLFLVKFIKAPGGGTIVSLHPSLLVGGVGQLEKVSTEARKLLTDYYKNCEGMYKVAAEIAKSNGTFGQ